MQAWLNFTGIALDAAGFCLLLREWWLAVFNEGRQLDMQGERQQAEGLRTFQSQHAPEAMRRHLETVGRMSEEAAIRRARDAHLATLAARRRMFTLAAVLIITGYLLQLLAAWPLGLPVI